MEWCGRTLRVLIFTLLVLVTQGKKVAVCLKEGLGRSDVDIIAEENQYKVIKQVTMQCFLLEKVTNKRAADNETDTVVEPLLLSNAAVREAEVSIAKVRVKRPDLPEHVPANQNTVSVPRDTNQPIREENCCNSAHDRRSASLDTLARTFHDPNFTKQWHLYNTDSMGNDLNVLPVWARNITGRGVTVAILDDGVEHTHPDIKDNYDATVSWDFLDDDDDPTPIMSPTDKDVDHGTRCAGQVAASKNYVCGVGVAYNANVAGIRMLKNKVEDAMEAEALKYRRDKIDIYSSSWGPIDDGKKMDGPGLLARTAFEEGVKYGRGGKGSIYVWASGNGGVNKDNCNCDGYCSSIYTISISAVNDKGVVPAYVEECAATLAAAYSSGTGAERRILTTDLNSGCTDKHGGTSAAAPLAAGVIALALSANPSLTWRDVQHIIVHSSSYPNNPDFIDNGAGRRVNNKIGFGILNSNDMVETAKTWVNVGEQRVCRIYRPQQELVLKDTRINAGRILKVFINTEACAGQSTEVAVLEHVQAVLSITHDRRGSLKISLESPAGTTSSMLTERPSDHNSQGFNRWPFLTVQMWGEQAAGRWILYIESVGDGAGELTHFELVLYGTKYDTNSTAQKCPKYTQYAPGGTGKVTCVNTCPRYGYYTANKMCLPCHSTCATCTDYNVCTSCPDQLFLYYEKNMCIGSCPEGYTIADSMLYGKLCDKVPCPSCSPWYKGDTVYILVVVIFITLLIVIVLVISVHHYRKHKTRNSAASLRYRDGAPSYNIPHTQLKPITASVTVPLRDIPCDPCHASRDPCHVTCELPPRTSRANSHDSSQNLRNSRANSHDLVQNLRNSRTDSVLLHDQTLR